MAKGRLALTTLQPEELIRIFLDQSAEQVSAWWPSPVGFYRKSHSWMFQIGLVSGGTGVGPRSSKT